MFTLSHHNQKIKFNRVFFGVCWDNDVWPPDVCGFHNFRSRDVSHRGKYFPLKTFANYGEIAGSSLLNFQVLEANLKVMIVVPIFILNTSEFITPWLIHWKVSFSGIKTEDVVCRNIRCKAYDEYYLSWGETVSIFRKYFQYSGCWLFSTLFPYLHLSIYIFT